jgi:hypothetical protein
LEAGVERLRKVLGVFARVAADVRFKIDEKRADQPRHCEVENDDPQRDEKAQRSERTRFFICPLQRPRSLSTSDRRPNGHRYLARTRSRRIDCGTVREPDLSASRAPTTMNLARAILASCE